MDENRGNNGCKLIAILHIPILILLTIGFITVRSFRIWAFIIAGCILAFLSLQLFEEKFNFPKESGCAILLILIFYGIIFYLAFFLGR